MVSTNAFGLKTIFVGTALGRVVGQRHLFLNPSRFAASTVPASGTALAAGVWGKSGSAPNGNSPFLGAFIASRFLGQAYRIQFCWSKTMPMDAGKSSKIEFCKPDPCPETVTS